MNKIKGCAFLLSWCLLFASCGQTSYLQAQADREAAEASADGGEFYASEQSGGSEGSADGDGPYASGQSAGADGAAETVYVQVAGAVAKPGVYSLPAGSRVFEAIELAGGLTADADDSDINQAAPVTDGQKLLILTAEERELLAAESGDSTESAEPDDGRVNINTATEEELMRLPGIGQSKAALIIKYRETHGAFSSIEGLMQVEGIKQGTYNKLCDHIKI